MYHRLKKILSDDIIDRGIVLAIEVPRWSGKQFHVERDHDMA
jgi:hypothetical protein